MKLGFIGTGEITKAVVIGILGSKINEDFTEFYNQVKIISLDKTSINTTMLFRSILSKNLNC